GDGGGVDCGVGVGLGVGVPVGVGVPPGVGVAVGVGVGGGLRTVVRSISRIMFNWEGSSKTKLSKPSWPLPMATRSLTSGVMVWLATCITRPLSKIDVFKPPFTAVQG